MTTILDNPIFLVGLPRSGSTLWLNVVSRHPKVFGIGEMLLLTPPWRRDGRFFLRTQVGDLSSEENVKRMINMMFSGNDIPGISASFWRYEVQKYDNPALKEEILTRLLNSDRSLQHIFKAMIEEIPRHYGSERCCAKFPVFVNYVPKLLEWYPKGKVIHIVRDPRAVAMSRALFHGERTIKNRQVTILFSSMQYVWTSWLHRRFGRFENYQVLRYEDLLADPESTVREMCEFVGLDFMPQMLEPEKGQASSITGRKTGGFNSAAASQWRSVISPSEEAMVTLLTTRSRKTFGYDSRS